MIKLTKILLIAVVLSGTTHIALADRGIGKKTKLYKVNLNITTPTILRNSIVLNLKSGLKYTGSVLVNQSNTSNSMIRNSVVTYQKGNSIYIIPYKQKVIIPEVKPGYTGMKLIIRPH